MNDSTLHDECELCLTPTELDRLENIISFAQCPFCVARHSQRMLELRRLALEERIDFN